VVCQRIWLEKRLSEWGRNKKNQGQELQKSSSFELIIT
jgi:hypothetical protein